MMLGSNDVEGSVFLEALEDPMVAFLCTGPLCTPV